MEDFKKIDLQNINAEDLVDIKSVKINLDLPSSERKKQFVEQVGNPYIFKCNGIIVKNTYSNNGKTLDELVEKVIIAF